MAPPSRQCVPLAVLEASLVCCCGAALMGDLSGAANPGSLRVWSTVVLVVDLCLVFAARRVVARAVVAMTCVFLATVETETAWRWGLFDAGFTSAVSYDDRRAIVQCAAPPCAVGAVSSFNALIIYLFVFLLDFRFTRGFADDVRGSIQLAQDVAEALADYDLVAAERTLEGNQAESLPAELRIGFGTLISNLASYRPYLPQHLSCLGHDGRDRDGVIYAPPPPSPPPVENSRRHGVSPIGTFHNGNVSVGRLSSSNGRSVDSWGTSDAGRSVHSSYASSRAEAVLDDSDANAALDESQKSLSKADDPERSSADAVLDGSQKVDSDKIDDPMAPECFT
eukprot:gene57528-biopygen70187